MNGTSGVLFTRASRNVFVCIASPLLHQTLPHRTSSPIHTNATGFGLDGWHVEGRGHRDGEWLHCSPVGGVEDDQQGQQINCKRRDAIHDHDHVYAVQLVVF